jgi:predicted RNase H-like HicB family nuclease
MSNTYFVNTTASGTDPYAHISSRPAATTSYHPPIATTPIFLAIDGPLTEERQLTFPIVVQIEYDDGEFLVSEDHFNIHASGATIREAIVAFKRVFAGYLDVLSEEEASLGSYLHEQLDYLRSAIRMG